MAADDILHAVANDLMLLALERAGRPAFVVDADGELIWAGETARRLIGGGGLDPATGRMLARVAASGASSLVRLRLGALGRLAPTAFQARPLNLANATRALALEGLTTVAGVLRPRLPHTQTGPFFDGEAQVAEAPGEEPAPASRGVAAAGEAATAKRGDVLKAENGAPAQASAPLDHDPSPFAPPLDLDAPPDPRCDLTRPNAPHPRPAEDHASAATSIEPAAAPAAETAPRALDHFHFVFEIDAGTRLAFLSPDLDAAVGASASAARGRPWREIAEALGLDQDGAVAAALGGRGRWGEIEVAWPTEDGRRTRLGLSALPMFDRGRTFVGFRGLGRSLGVVPDRSENADDGGAHDRAAGVGPVATESASSEPSAMVAREPPAPAAEDGRLLRDLQARAFAPLTTRSEAVESPVRPVPPFEAPPAAAPFPENVVPIREQGRPPSLTLSATEEDAFDEIARRLGTFGARRPEPAAPPSAPETAEIVPTPAAGADWTLDDVDGRAPTASRVDDLLRLLDRLPVGALVLRAGEVAYANRATLDMLGARDLDRLASRGAEALFAEPLPRDDAAPATTRLVAADGVEIEVEARLSSMTWRGAPATLVSLKRAEGSVAAAQAALEREREASAILEVATDGVLTLDGAGRILSVNRGAETLFGFEARDVVGGLFTLSLAPESRRAAFDYLDRLKTDGDAAIADNGREVVGLARQGGAIPLYMTMARVGGPDANRFCAMLRDVTPWKKAEEELLAAKRQAERANAQKSEFLAKVSHEIRTPLNAIIGFSEVMMEERFGPVGSPRYKDYLRDIHSSGGHLIGLVNDLLDLTRIESGGVKLDFSPVDLNEIVQQAALLLQPQASRDHVIIRTSLARGLPPVLADRRSVRQIMTNLASNAVRLSRPGGQVIVATALTDVGQAVIRVRDAGLGMTKQELARALEPFRPLGAADNDAGAALCLPLTKALAEANEAGFALQSELGQGTLAEVTFPASRVLAS